MKLIEKALPYIKVDLSKIAETFIVLTLGFGLFIYSSTIAFFENLKTSTTKTYDNFDFIVIIGYEIIILSIISYYLKKRGWTIKDFNLDFTPNMIGIAIILVIIRVTTGVLLTHFFTMFGVYNLEILNNKPNILFQTNIVIIGLISIVNSIYEEVLLIGYFFKRFEKYHSTIIIIGSLIVRASYHTYQGWENLLNVFILALVFGLYYIQYKKLYPLIIAHGIGNVFHFLNYYNNWFDI